MNRYAELSKQWNSRPQDERFLNTTEMYQDAVEDKRSTGTAIVALKDCRVICDSDGGAPVLIGPSGAEAVTNNWSYQQLCQRAEAPAGYLRELSCNLRSQCLNEGLQKSTDSARLMLTRTDTDRFALRAATSETYGYVHDSDIIRQIRMFVGNGDGTDTDWRVPTPFKRAGDGKDHVPVTKDTATLFRGDRDSYGFLTNERMGIEISKRRNGETGLANLGFYWQHSMVGKCGWEIGVMLYDYTCSNYNVWGAELLKQVKFRHSKNINTRWQQSVQDVIEADYEAARLEVENLIRKAQAKQLGKPEDVIRFLSKHFTNKQVEQIALQHEMEEHRPIETLWDANVGATAYAKVIPFRGDRIEIENKASKLLALAA